MSAWTRGRAAGVGDLRARELRGELRRSAPNCDEWRAELRGAHLARDVDAAEVVARVGLGVPEVLRLGDHLRELAAALQPGHHVAQRSREGPGDARDGVGGGDGTLHRRDDGHAGAHRRLEANAPRRARAAAEAVEDVERRRERLLVRRGGAQRRAGLGALQQRRDRRVGRRAVDEDAAGVVGAGARRHRREEVGRALLRRPRRHLVGRRSELGELAAAGLVLDEPLERRIGQLARRARPQHARRVARAHRREPQPVPLTVQRAPGEDRAEERRADAARAEEDEGHVADLVAGGHGVGRICGGERA